MDAREERRRREPSRAGLQGASSRQGEACHDKPRLEGCHGKAHRLHLGDAREPPHHLRKPEEDGKRNAPRAEEKPSDRKRAKERRDERNAIRPRCDEAAEGDVERVRVRELRAADEFRMAEDPVLELCGIAPARSALRGQRIEREEDREEEKELKPLALHSRRQARGFHGSGSLP